MNIKLDLEALSGENRAFFCEMLPYVSTHIRQIQKTEEGIFAEADDAYADEVQAKCQNLKDMILGGKLANKEIPIKTLIDRSEVQVLNHDPVFAKLAEQESVIEICKGVYAYAGLFLKIMRYFDKKIAEFGYANFEGLKEHEYPVLYPVEKYAKGRYFETFPHFIMFQTVMNNDLDTLGRFAEQGVSDPAIFEEMKTPVNVLRHAACAPIYEILSGRTISPEKPEVYMVKGKCFRNEADNVFELARVNEFTMKEYVFIGTPEQCNDGIQSAKALWKFWADIFGLNCKLDTANDSFFASNYQKLKLFQILGDSKQEFKWYVPFSESYIACSSANFHRTHFSKPYQIRTDAGTYCNTACFAFGIERMAYAFLNQKGIDPQKWDKATFDEISAYETL
ncbi:MAG: hypothetical protein IKI45_14030 [Oscillospiraceae bacterium]|nr:hypothetical protein [Oscillospiraceae bacterium]